MGRHLPALHGPDGQKPLLSSRRLTLEIWALGMRSIWWWGWATRAPPDLQDTQLCVPVPQATCHRAGGLLGQGRTLVWLLLVSPLPPRLFLSLPPQALPDTSCSPRPGQARSGAGCELTPSGSEVRLCAGRRATAVASPLSVSLPGPPHSPLPGRLVRSPAMGSWALQA